MINLRDSYIKVDWDPSRRDLFVPLWGKVNDTGRGLVVTIYQKGLAVSVTTETLRINWEKTDGTEGFVDAVPSGGKFYVEELDQMFSVPGIVKADLQLQVGAEFIKSDTFKVPVIPSIADQALLSSSDFSALQDALGQIDSFASQLAETMSLADAMAGGSPKGAYATLVALQTAYPTGTTGAFVVTANGHLYFWNGTWTDSGIIYQAIGMDETLKNTAVNFLAVPTITNKIPNGNFTTLTGWVSAGDFGREATLSVANNTLTARGTTTARVGVKSPTGIFEINKKYYVKIKVRVTNSNCQLIQLKQGDVALIAEVVSPVLNQWYTMEGVFTVTSVVHTFLHFFHMYADAATALNKDMEIQSAMTIDLTTKYGVGNEPTLPTISALVGTFPNAWFDATTSLFNANNVLSRVDGLEENEIVSVESIAKDIFIDKTVIKNININYLMGAAQVNASFGATSYIKVEPNTTYKVKQNDHLYSSTGNMAFYDQNKVFISGQGSVYENFTTPANAVYVRFSVYYERYNENTFTFADMSIVKGNQFLPIDERPTVNGFNVYDNLKGKKWVGIGDSLTEINARADLRYHDYIKQELGLEFVNMGVGGTGYKNRDNEATGVAFYQRALSCPTDADIVTIFGFVNDALFMTVPIGTALDTETTTWCGCVNKTIDNLESLYTYLPLGIITPLPCDWIEVGQTSYPTQRPDDLTCRVSLMVDKLVEIYKLRGIPYLDLFHTSNLHPWDADVKAEYFSCGTTPTGDGLHPNSRGHKAIYRKIMEFVKTLART